MNLNLQIATCLIAGALISAGRLAADEFDIAVCNAYQDAAARDRCLANVDMTKRATATWPETVREYRAKYPDMEPNLLGRKLKACYEVSSVRSEIAKCVQKSISSEPPTEPAQTPTPTRTTNWKEIAEKHLAEANTYCANRVERLGKYDFEWTDGWLELKFSRYLPSENPGVIIYMGDKIKFQNGFGAWQPHIYVCEFDTRTNTVLDVSATPGRFP